MPTLNTLFISLLAQSSGETPVGFLDARTRWSLFNEICIGNAKVKGGRSRDYPFSAQRHDNTELTLHLAASYINNKYLQCFKTKVRVSKLNFLIAAMTFEIAKIQNVEPVSSELYYSSMLSKLIDITFDENSHESTQIKQLMGVSSFGRDNSTKHYPNLHVQCAMQLALLASITLPEGLNTQDAKQYIINHINDIEILKILQSRTLDLMYLKPKKVQTYLDNCSKSFIQRGASYWCSQFIALVRDVIDRNTVLPSVLLTDCDSVSIRALSSSEDKVAIQQAIFDYFIDKNEYTQLDRNFVNRHLPRLLPYFEIAKKENIYTCNVLPDIELSVRKNVTIIDLLVERSSLNDWVLPQKSTENTIHFQHEYTVDRRLNCDACSSEPAFELESMQTPSWYAKGRGDKYGFKSVFLSLVGLNVKKNIQHNFGQSIFPSLGQEIAFEQSLKNLATRSCKSRTELCMIKYDGDKIGCAFTERCFISRPELSIQLEVAFRNALIKTVIDIVDRYKLDFCPVELVYFGGDDLFIVLASCYAIAFVKCFNRHLNNRLDKLGFKLTASFVGFHFTLPTVKGQHSVGKDSEKIILSIMNEAMESIKSTGKISCQYPEYPNFKPYVVEAFELSCTKGAFVSTINLESLAVTLGPTLQSVLSFAIQAHGSINQRRKYDDSDYIVHPISVMQKVQGATNYTEEMLAAALLHDTVEDTKVCLSDIETKFGKEIATMVDFLTDKSRPEDGNRAIRKEIDRRHIAKAPANVKTIKLADLLDNSQSILRFAPSFAHVFVKEVSLLLQVLGDGDRELFEQLQKVVNDFENDRAS